MRKENGEWRKEKGKDEKGNNENMKLIL